MVVEYIRYTVPAAQAEAFERAYSQAGAILEQDPRCLAFEVAGGVEQPGPVMRRQDRRSFSGLCRVACLS